MSATVLFAPHYLSGKAPTVRITVSGRNLARTIQITDAKALYLSNAWGTTFLDISKPPLVAAPNVSSTYEVTFYSEIGTNDIRKTCVFFYSPNPPAKQGVVYLPGKGSLWALNAGTVIRQGRDGKWNYASPDWEALIKPFIAIGEAENGLRSASGANTRAAEQQDQDSSAISDIAVEEWTRPQPGWLYVLDPRSGPLSRVFLLDQEKSKVMGSVRAGYDPDLALSPDGSRLYVISGERESGRLAAIDTSTGTLRLIPFANRVLYKPWYQGLPPFSGAAADDKTVWLPGQQVLSPGLIESRLWVFDTRSETLLKTTVDLGNCGYVDIVPFSATNRSEFLCGGFLADSNRIRLVRLDDQRREISNTPMDLAWPKGCAVAELFPSSSHTIAVVRSDGAIYQADSPAQKLSTTYITANCSDWAIAHAEWPRSPDGAKVYLGYGGIAPDGMSAATELRVFDTTTWKQLGRVQTSVPFWSAVASHDGKYIYAVAPAQHRVLVIDAVTLHERRTIDVGNVPSLALVAP